MHWRGIVLVYGWLGGFVDWRIGGALDWVLFVFLCIGCLLGGLAYCCIRGLVDVACLCVGCICVFVSWRVGVLVSWYIVI